MTVERRVTSYVCIFNIVCISNLPIVNSCFTVITHRSVFALDHFSKNIIVNITGISCVNNVFAKA